MGKFKELWNGPQKSFFRYAIFATGIFLLSVGFLREENAVRWIRAEIELRRQDRQIRRYREEIADMDRQIKRLSNDRDTLEQFARENFYFHRPDEDVYIYRK